MKIAIGSDHRGYELKNDTAGYLIGLDHYIKDFGTYSEKSFDYPITGRMVAKAVGTGRYERGILVCGSGIGMCIAANRFPGVRAALCVDVEDAKRSRRHNNTNILVLASEKTGYQEAKNIIDAWLETGFEAGRHQRRIMEIDNSYVMVGVSLLSKPEEMEINSLIEKIKRFEECGTDEIHFDVMDGKYNDNNTWEYQGPHVIKDLRKHTELPFMAHLMIEDPIKHIQEFGDAGCDIVVFHYEACRNPKTVEVTIDRIKSCNMQAGIAIEPETPVDVVFPYLDNLDRVLVMTVRTGYAGQGFIDKTDKIRSLANKTKGYEFWIAVDGGINQDTAALCRSAGANMFYAASYIQKSEDPKSAINSLRGSL
jgi:ribulose-phosphate 3-epimerase